MVASPATVMPKYECDNCGACCKSTLIVEAEELDVLREPRLIFGDPHGRRIPVEQMVQEMQTDWKGVILASGRPCSYLDADNRCANYSTRPNCCVGLQAGDEQCQAAHSAQGLPPLEPGLI